MLDLARSVFNPDVYRGREGIGRNVGEVDEMWERFDAEPLEFIDEAIEAARGGDSCE